MNRAKYLAAGGAAGLLLVVVGIWFFIFRDTAPPAASLDDAVGSVTSTTAAGSTATSTTAPSTATDSSGGSLDGTWAIDTNVGGGVVDDGSYVGYRMQEELATIGAKTAVGRTTALTGSLEFRGTSLVAASIVVDMTQLMSDDSRRDSQMERQALETTAFPEASFTLSEPVDLGTVPTPGAAFALEATGDLTLHGVSNRVTVPIDGQLVGDTVVVVGSLEILLADYDIDKPSAGIVLSVDDRGEMEFQLFLTRS